jgi:hypothetical protein
MYFWITGYVLGQQKMINKSSKCKKAKQHFYCQVNNFLRKTRKRSVFRVCKFYEQEENIPMLLEPKNWKNVTSTWMHLSFGLR